VNSVDNVNDSVDIERWVAQRYADDADDADDADECAPCYRPGTTHKIDETSAQHQDARAPTQPQLNTNGVQGSFERCHLAKAQQAARAKEHLTAEQIGALASEIKCHTSEIKCHSFTKAQLCHSPAPTQSQHSSPTAVMHADTSHDDAGAAAGAGDKADEIARRKRALHTIINADSSWSRHGVTAPRAGVRDPLDGYPGKSVILAMRRRDLECLAAKFPSILPLLPHRHVHVSRYSSWHNCNVSAIAGCGTHALCDGRALSQGMTHVLHTAPPQKHSEQALFDCCRTRFKESSRRQERKKRARKNL
jgi:hypothetical protein